MMRRYLAYCPEEEPRIFQMLDQFSRGAQGHGAVDLLLLILVLPGMVMKEVGSGPLSLPSG